jgi:hypothetical protein
MKKKIRKTVFAKNHPIPSNVPTHVAGQGSLIHGKKCQPPRKIVVKIAEPTTM